MIALDYKNRFLSLQEDIDTVTCAECLRNFSALIAAHQIELVPNVVQRIYFAKSCGIARLAFNWGLKEWEKQYAAVKHLPREERPFINEMALRKQFNSIKRTEFPFVTEVSKYVPQEAIRQLGVAFTRFFKGQSRYPKLRRKFKRDRFTIGNDQVKVMGNKIHLPKIGWIKMREEIRFDGAIRTVTIRRMADRWFVSFSLKVDDTSRYYSKTENQGGAGGDMGLTHMMVLSNGKRYDNPKPLKRALKRLRLYNKQLARRRKGSKNRIRTIQRLARLHQRVANIRKDAVHKMTTEITSTYSYFCIETLNIKGMKKNKKLAPSIADVPWYEIKRQLIYKGQLRGCDIVEAPMFYPSSKLCSACGEKNNELKLSQRTWTCSACGTLHDRDVNAGMNLLRYAASSAVKALGDGCSGLVDHPSSETSVGELRTENLLESV